MTGASDVLQKLETLGVVGSVGLTRWYSDYDINSRSKPHLNVGTIGYVSRGVLMGAVVLGQRIARCPRPSSLPAGYL